MIDELERLADREEELGRSGQAYRAAGAEIRRLRKMLSDVARMLTYDQGHRRLRNMVRRVLDGKSPVPAPQLSEDEIRKLRAALEKQ